MICLLFGEWKPKMLDKIFFQRVVVFTFLLQHAFFFTYVKAEFLANFCKRRFFGFIVMKSGPRHRLNTSLLRLLYARWTLEDRKILGWIGTGRTCITLTEYMYNTDMDLSVSLTLIYTETIKLCPLDVYVCQFQMYERISFKFSLYQMRLFRKVFHLREIYLVINRAADKAANTSTLKFKSHNINSLCDHHIPEF